MNKHLANFRFFVLILLMSGSVVLAYLYCVPSVDGPLRYTIVAGASPLSVSGKINDQNNAPVAGVLVEVETDSGLQRATTDTSGVFRIAMSEKEAISIRLVNYGTIRWHASSRLDVRAGVQVNIRITG